MIKYKQLGDVNQAYVLMRLMQLWQTTGNKQLAIFFGKQSVAAFQKFRQNVQSLGNNTDTLYLKRNEIPYRELTEMLISEKRYDESLEILSFFKENEYFSNLGQTISSSSYKDVTFNAGEQKTLNNFNSVTNQVIKIESEISLLKNKNDLTDEEKQKLLQLETAANQSGIDYNNFANSLPAEFSKKAGTNKMVIPIADKVKEDLKELNAKANVGAVYVLIGKQSGYLLLATKKKINAFSIPMGAQVIEDLITRFRSGLVNPLKDPRGPGNELYKILVKPLEDDLKKENIKTIMWSLDGRLRYIPIAALYDKKHKQYMVERYQNVLFTPANQHDLSVASGKKVRALGVGVSEPELGFTPLPAVKEELEGIVRRKGENFDSAYEGERFLNGEFSKKAFLAELEKKEYPIVHISSHFGFRSDSPLESALLLGDKQMYSLAEMQKSSGLFRGVEILGLSACQTGINGENANGKEIESFAIFAQQQGAKAVLASLWKVEDKSTADLMKNFYRIYSSTEKMSKAEAIQRAQLNLFNTRKPDQNNPINKPEITTKGDIPIDFDDKKTDDLPPFQPDDKSRIYEHPYFWSSFILVGNWQ